MPRKEAKAEDGAPLARLGRGERDGGSDRGEEEGCEAHGLDTLLRKPNL